MVRGHSPIAASSCLGRHLLKEELLHHVVQCTVQGRVVEQRAGRPEPPVEVHHLVVSIDVVILHDLLHPAHHHALQDPAERQVGLNFQGHTEPQCLLILPKVGTCASFLPSPAGWILPCLGLGCLRGHNDEAQAAENRHSQDRGACE